VNSELLALVNEAQERLLNRATTPVGATMKYRACVGSSNCLVWPRQIRTITAWWLCNQPGIVAGEPWETIGWTNGGYGLAEGACVSGDVLVDQGTACSYDNVVSSSTALRKIQAVASDASDNGKEIHLRYYDSNGNRKYSGGGLEGETLTLSTSGVLTSSNVMTNGLYHVTKAVTNFPIRLYSWNVGSATQSALLGIYEPSETAPIYRSTYVPGLTGTGGCCSHNGSECTTVPLTVLARLQHVPVVMDQDSFVIGNMAALKLAVKAITLEEKHEQAMAAGFWGQAAAELDGELSAYRSESETPIVRVPDVECWGMGGVMNAI
jgi:hypothetical protein